jgi:hypothetical protein
MSERPPERKSSGWGKYPIANTYIASANYYVSASGRQSYPYLEPRRKTLGFRLRVANLFLATANYYVSVNGEQPYPYQEPDDSDLTNKNIPPDA